MSLGSRQGQASSMDHYAQRTPRIFPSDVHASLYEMVGGGSGITSLFGAIPTRAVCTLPHSMRLKGKKATSSCFISIKMHEPGMILSASCTLTHFTITTAL